MQEETQRFGGHLFFSLGFWWLLASRVCSTCLAFTATGYIPLATTAPTEAKLPDAAEALPPVFVQEPSRGALPVCDCTGLHHGTVHDAACSIGFSDEATDFCFIPPSYCATVESGEMLTVNGSRLEEYSILLVDWGKTKESADYYEKALPRASTPTCRCWPFNGVMVAPCEQQWPPQVRAEGTGGSNTSAGDLSAASESILAGGVLSRRQSALKKSFVSGGDAPDAAIHRNLFHTPIQATGLQRLSKWARHLAVWRQAITGDSHSSKDVTAPSVNTTCHKGCASCLQPGRDRCLTCFNQLPYPYRPLPAGSHPPNPNKLPSDIYGSNAYKKQYHAHIAAHRDGSGYCIPLAFGGDALAAAHSSCLASDSSCVKKNVRPLEQPEGGFLELNNGSHCHASCAACRADCCRGKADNCLACTGPSRIFHSLYGDGTGRCIDLRLPDDQVQTTNLVEKGQDEGMMYMQQLANFEGEETGSFSAVLQSIISIAFSSPAAPDTGKPKVAASLDKSRNRKGPSFLPRRSICDSLPQRIGDMPTRAWSQLMFVHADNNLEESALLDLEEMLHPWRGEVVKRYARAAMRGRGTPPLPVGGSALSGSTAQEALEDLYLVVLIDRSKQTTSTDMGTVHACPELEYSSLGQGVRQLPGTSEVELNAQMAFELLRIHLQDGRREWLLLRSLGEVDMNDPGVLRTAVTRLLDIFPSRHYAVILWNHGSAWAGFGDDESNPNNQPMSIHDIALGLKNGISGSKLGKVDPSFRLSLLGFDACLMGSYDVLEALAPVTHFFLASEENEPGHGWNYRSMDPTSLTRKPPPPYRTATAFEYGARFVTSYGLHPPSSNALTLALIEVRAFNEFKQKFEELLEGLYSCGGSNITRRVRRALSQTFSVRGCRMLGLCSCYDLNDFLANLLQQFASEENDLGRISMQSLGHDDELSWDDSNSEMRDITYRRLQHTNGQLYAINALGAAQRALTDKVVAARVFFKRMVVAEVGSREPGRYGGLSIYFPDPNMAVNCKTHRSAASWARRYTSTIRTKFSSFVSSVLSNRKGSVCYAPWGGTGDAAQDATGTIPQHAAEAPQWFGILCSRVLKSYLDKHLGAAVGISAVLPATVASAMMFRGFAASVANNGKPEIIITSTAQATMTDAEVKSSTVPLTSSGMSEEAQRLHARSKANLPGSRAHDARAEPSDTAAALREFTVVQGWWDTQVWILKQQLRLDDSLKDPRPRRQTHNGSAKDADVEAIVVAIQDGPASSRFGAGRGTTFSFPFLFFKDALAAECLEDSLLHTEALSAPKSPQNSFESRSTAGQAKARMLPADLAGFKKRSLQELSSSPVEDMNKQEASVKRHILSSVVLPLATPSEDFQIVHDVRANSQEQASSSSLQASSSDLRGSQKPKFDAELQEKDDDVSKVPQPRQLSSVRAGAASWLLHERLGREPQRHVDKKRQCGARAYLLAEWDENRRDSSELVLYVVEDEQATEWPRSKGGLLRPIEHRLRRTTVFQQYFEQAPSSIPNARGGSPRNKGTSQSGISTNAAYQPRSSATGHQTGFSSGHGDARFSESLSFTRAAGSQHEAFWGQQADQGSEENVAAVVLEESLGEATFFWNVESEVDKLVLQPRSISSLLRERRSKMNVEGSQVLENTERPVVGFIAQDLFDQRAVAASAVPLTERQSPSFPQSLWESIEQTFGFGDYAQETLQASNALPSSSTCQPYWLGDGICDEICDTAAYEFDGGDCVHLNAAAEDLLEQQEPKGACVGNRCSEIALCEAYEDTSDEGRGQHLESHIKTKPHSENSEGKEAEGMPVRSEPQETPLVATIWEGPRGRYVCRCPKGYTGDGTSCEDIDECKVFEEAVCHAKAICINTKGSYRCLCKPGYTGDGRDVCMPSNQSYSVREPLCVDSNNRPLCPPTLHCLADGSCGCREGYTMDNGSCIDIDECSSGLASCASPSIATCVNTSGGYFCSCVDGYEGDGRQCVASPSTAEAEISIAMDYHKTVAAAGGIQLLKEALIDAILQAIPGLGDRKRIEVLSIYEGSINAVLRIHPPVADGPASSEGSDSPRQLTAAEALLALQEQLEEPLSVLRTGPFGEYAAYATIERYTFLDRSSANTNFDLLAFLTDWLPEWLKDSVPRELLAALELLLLLICIAVVGLGLRRAIKRSRRGSATPAARHRVRPRRGS